MIQTSTHIVAAKDIKRNWHLVDAEGKILGRLAVDIAKLLMGKNKPSFVRYIDTGDYVVVTNASKITVTGKKSTEKKYVRHSGYPGGLKVETFDKLIVRKPEAIIEHAVKGMLPKTKLGRAMVKKLYVFAGPEHTFTKQLGEVK